MGVAEPRAAWLSLLACLAAPGLARQPGQGGDPVFRSQASEDLYLGAADCERIRLEVDTVEGAFGADELVAILRGALQELCDKPEGIVVVRDDPIPAEATRGRERAEVAIERMGGLPADERDGSTAYLYLLVDDGELSGMRPYEPHVRPEYRCAIFYDDAYVRRGAEELAAATGGDVAGWYERLRPEVVLHELGHVLGLVVEGEHGADLHCTDTACRSTARLSQAMAGAWCAACRADLAAARARSEPQPLRFHGAALVREERGYWVVSLPGYVEVDFLAPDELAWEELRARALESVRSSDVDVAYEIYFDHPEDEDLAALLRSAARDGNPLVAGLARRAAEAFARRRADSGEDG